MSEVLCYDSMTGKFFRYDEAELHKRINELNKQLFDPGYLSINEVYDILNRDRPEDKQIRPSLHGWGDEHGYAHKVGDVEFVFGVKRARDQDDTIYFDLFGCFLKEEEP